MGILRKTASLSILLSEFNKFGAPQAIAVIDLTKRLREQLNKSTIYRILDKLEEDGVLHSFLDTNGVKWYAKCKHTCTKAAHQDVHPHFQCTECGQIDCVEVAMPMPKIPNRVVEKIQVLITGKCEQCSVV